MSDKGTEYENLEALIEIGRKLGSIRMLETKPLKRAAGISLADKVVDIFNNENFEPLGFNTKHTRDVNHDAWEISWKQSSDAPVAIQVFDEGLFRLIVTGPGRSVTGFLDPKIGFNVYLGKWEGLDNDSFFTPEPGQPKSKRSAVASVVDVIISYFITDDPESVLLEDDPSTK